MTIQSIYASTAKPRPDPLTTIAQQRARAQGLVPPGAQQPAAANVPKTTPSPWSSNDAPKMPQAPSSPVTTAPMTSPHPRAAAVAQLAGANAPDPLMDVARQRAQAVQARPSLLAPTIDQQRQQQPTPPTPMQAQSNGGAFAGVNTSGAVGFGGQRNPNPGNGQEPSMPTAPTTPTISPTLPQQPSANTITPDQAKQRALDEAKQKSRDATAAWEQAHGGAPYNPNGNARQDAIAQLDAQQQQDMQAAKDQYAASKAQQLQGAGARSGLGGFGLSGASATLQGDTARAADRNETLGLAQLRQQQQQEKFRGVQQTAVISDLEASENLDLDHDGTVAGVPVGKKTGDGNPDDFNADMNPDKAATKPKASTLGGDIANASKSAGDYLFGSGFDDPHTALRPNGRQALPGGFNASDPNIVDGGLTLGGVAGLDTYIGSDAKYDYYKGSDGKVHREPRQ